jgi:low temperature requirement protein LtrA
MATGDDVEEVREAEASHRPAFLELFFDLAYVLALITLAGRLVAELTWVTAVETLILFLAFSLIWALTAWAGDTFDLNRPAIQAQVIWVMLGTLVMAGAVPGAFDDRGLLFVAGYLGINLGSAGYYMLFEHDPALRSRSHRIFSWFCVTTPAWLAGAFVGDTPRAVLWAVAITAEYGSAYLGWPIPRFGRLPAREWRLVGERVSERYRQFFIIALGVTVFVMGLAVGRGNYTTERITALGTLFATTVLMCRIYIYRAGEMLTNAIAVSANPSRFSQFAAVAHLIMVIGVLVAAVTDQLVLERPLGHTPAGWGMVILGGPALFLVGRGLLDYTVFSRVSWSRPVGVLLLAGMAPAVPRLPPLGVAGAATAILLGIAVGNVIATQVHPRDPAPPLLR